MSIMQIEEEAVAAALIGGLHAVRSKDGFMWGT